MKNEPETPGFNACYHAYPMSDEVTQVLDALASHANWTDPEDRNHQIYRWRVQRWQRDVVKASALALTIFIEQHPTITLRDRRVLEKIAARLQTPFEHANALADPS